MHDRPGKEALLGAIARFLERDVRPALKDPGLGFRALIAAHLATTVAAELAAEDELDAAELSRLSALLPDVAAGAAPATREARRAERRRLNAELSRRIRARALSAAVQERAFAHVMQTLREELAVHNSKFDTSPDADEGRAAAPRGGAR